MFRGRVKQRLRRHQRKSLWLLGFKDLFLLLLLYVVVFLSFFFYANQVPTMLFHRGSAATSWDTEPQG